MKTKSLLLGSCAVLAGVAMSNASAAQQAPQDAPPSDTATAIDEIIVTAQRRSQDIQSVPLSIRALSGEQLEEQGVDDVSDLGRIIPNFTASRSASTANLRLNIRGIGAAGNTAVDQSVAVFLDGVYVARPSALYASFLDIAGVEVVRGPQGTLFGRNTTAGGVLLRSAEPGFEFGGSVIGQVGNYGRRKVEAVVNLPASDTVRFRAAVQGSEFDGYGFSTTTGERFGYQDQIAGRLSAAVDFSDALTWLGRADYSHVTGDGQASVEAIGSTIGATQRTALAARLGGLLPELDDHTDHRVAQLVSGEVDDEQFGLSSRLAWRLPGDYELKLISGYRDYTNSQFDGEVNFMPVEIASRTTSLGSESSSHELQLASPQGLFGGRANYVAGLYYFQEDTEITEGLSITPALCNIAVPAGPGRTACLNGPLQNVTGLAFQQSAESVAIFAQGDWLLTDQLTLQVGGRYTRDEKDGSFVQTIATPIAAALRAPETTSLTFSDEQPTYRIALSWKAAEDLMIFGSYSTGYKAGGFNSGGGAAALGTAKRSFGSETATNLELGVRSDWLDNRLQTNITLYRTELEDFQDRSFDGTSFVIRNAGSLRHQGVEADGRFRFGGGFAVAASVAYLDSEFLDFKTAPALPGCSAATPAITGCGPVGGVRTIQDLTGKRAHYAPEWQSSLTGTWDRDLPGGWSMHSLVGMSFVGDQFVGSVTDNNAQTLQEAYTLFNARLSFVAPGERWEIAVFGDNLTDEGYCPNMIYQPNDSLFGVRDATTGGTLTRCIVAPPRTYGVSLRARF